MVHGRDHESRDQLRLILFTLRLDPFVLLVTGGGGDTLIEALERMIVKSAQSAFAIVLLTPDDMGYLAEEKPEDAKPRARHNVIMEMGIADPETLRYLAKRIRRTPIEYGGSDHHSIQQSRKGSGSETRTPPKRSRLRQRSAKLKAE